MLAEEAVKIPLGRSVMKTAGGSRIKLRRSVDGDGGGHVDVRTSSGAAKLEEFDILTADGVVHVIDAVLVPDLSDLDEGQILEFKVYPNPASDNIKIDVLDNNFDQAMIYDMNGRIILDISLENFNSIDISLIESGIYTLGLRSNDQMITQKLQVN